MSVNGPDEEITRLSQVYTTHVLARRHRVVSLLGRKCASQVMLTLLGFEVKAGSKRITCPDLATARYVRLFAEIGMRTIRVPYDPTVTATLVPELESLFASLKAKAAGESTGRDRERLIRRKCRDLKLELEKADEQEASGPTLSRGAP